MIGNDRNEQNNCTHSSYLVGKLQAGIVSKQMPYNISAIINTCGEIIEIRISNVNREVPLSHEK